MSTSSSSAKGQGERDVGFRLDISCGDRLGYLLFGRRAMTELLSPLLSRNSFIINELFKKKYGRDLDDTGARWMQAFFVLAGAINRARVRRARDASLKEVVNDALG